MITQKKLGQKIREFRKSLGLSQLELAKKMGFSRVTITQIESGQRGLEALELVKISDIFDVDPVCFLRDEEPKNRKKKAVEKNNKIIFHREKLENAILYILDKCGGKPNIGETVLYKLLYFSDFDFFELYGTPITGMKYVKLKYGPVPQMNEYNPVILEMSRNNKLKIITQEYHGYIQKRYIALVDCVKNKLTERELNVLDSVVAKYSHMNANEIELFVHGDAPWAESEDQEIIDYNLVFNRFPPYAHRDYSKEFIKVGNFDVVEDLGKMSKKEHDYYENL